MNRSPAFNKTYIASSIKYSVTLSLADYINETTGELNPGTVRAENFVVTDRKSGFLLDITDVIYKPVSREVVLTVGPGQIFGLNCTTECKEGLMYKSGASVPIGTVQGEIVPEYMCEVDGISVQSIMLYSDGVGIYYPSVNVAFDAHIVVANATETEQTKEVVLYRNDAEIARQSVVIPAYGTARLVIGDLTVQEWNEKDEIKAMVQ